MNYVFNICIHRSNCCRTIFVSYNSKSYNSMSTKVTIIIFFEKKKILYTGDLLINQRGPFRRKLQINFLFVELASKTMS